MKYLKNDLTEAKSRYITRIYSELLVVLLVVAGLASLGVSFTPTYASKAELSEIFSSISTLRADISQYYMETGEWPEKMNLDQTFPHSEDVIQSIEFDGDGTINYYLSGSYENLAEKVISFSATISDSKDWENLIWVCGYAKPMQGYRLQGENITNIEPLLLPSVCRI